MIVIGALLFLMFPIWDLWLIISLMFGNKLLTPARIYKLIITSLKFKKMELDYHTILVSRLSYYRNLNQEDQRLFYERVKKFIADKEFIPMEISEVNITDKLLIASSAVQLTFGLDEFILSRFHTIYVYPNHFYNRNTKHYHKGEVNLHGTISLSLHDFHEGNKNETDGINLGLHEMAHALRVEQFLEQDQDDFFNTYYAKFSIELANEMKSSENNDFIRAYGKTNKHEFFAVAVENFFERPKQFKELMPQLYEHFVLLLNQNPLDFNLKIDSIRNVIEDTFVVEEQSKGDLVIEKGYKPSYYGLAGAILFAVIQYNTFSYSFVFPIIFLFFDYVKHKKVAIYQNGIIVRSLFQSHGNYYSFSRIVLILMVDKDVSKFVAKYRSHNKIKNKWIESNLNENEKHQFFELLKQHKIGIKSVGKL